MAWDGGSAGERPCASPALLSDGRRFSFRVGRMAGRLPCELADDVVGSVLDCFRYVWRGREPCFWLKAAFAFCFSRAICWRPQRYFPFLKYIRELPLFLVCLLYLLRRHYIEKS